MKVKIDKRDTVFSKLVRERANQLCERCGRHSSEVALQCSHIFSRRHVATRWHPDNAQCLCFGCHKWWHESPAQSGVWIRELLGDGVIDLLEERRNQIKKYSKVVREDIHRHLLSEYKIMIDKRNDGISGRIEFEAFD